MSKIAGSTGSISLGYCDRGRFDVTLSHIWMNRRHRYSYESLKVVLPKKELDLIEVEQM